MPSSTPKEPLAWRDDPRALKPMLATTADAALDNPRLVYEPKYDGVRTIVQIEPGAKGEPPRVTLWSRLKNVKNVQFPELANDLQILGKSLGKPVVLDGEIVALDEADVPASFLRLQGRLRLTRPRDVERVMRVQPVAFYGFDILRDGDEDVRSLPFTDRRKRLKRCFRRKIPTSLRLTESVVGDGRPMYARAEAEGWEGLIAKEASSRYESGRRGPAWRKLKITRRQEFVVGGWTAPRGARSHFGALLVGVHDGRRLLHAGQVGGGFTDDELARVAARLAPIERPTCPFDPPLRSTASVHWVEPILVAEVRYTEWTIDGKLRHPVYLGMRSDLARARVTREPHGERSRISGPSGTAAVTKTKKTKKTKKRTTRLRAGAARAKPAPAFSIEPAVQLVIDQLQDLEDRRRDGTLQLPDPAERLKVTNPHKMFWPALGITKGELLRYYARISSLILPVVEDRPLVMKRFPDGIGGNAFYQQRRVREAPPPGVRVEPLPKGIDPIGETSGAAPDRFVGGSLLTLLYMTQMAAISQDPWFSRVGTLEFADRVAIDLDPMDGVPFARVLDVARWVRDELETLETPGFPKTSGSRGIHIYIPMPPRTSYQSGMLFCQIVATVVATRHPKVATVTRSVAARGQTVYIDYLQNILGKTLATTYSARASDYAGVSTPVTWQEIDDGLDPRDFTIRTAPTRFAAVGDLWDAIRSSKPADPRRAFRYAEMLEGKKAWKKR